tara:strand:- start:77 stop:265 length:189 start_codon:yes stop_codon:yes gene_type:complete
MYEVWHVIYGIRALPEGYANGLRNILYANGHLGHELPANLPVTAWDGGLTNSSVFWLGNYSN